MKIKHIFPHAAKYLYWLHHRTTTFCNIVADHFKQFEKQFSIKNPGEIFLQSLMQPSIAKRFLLIFMESDALQIAIIIQIIPTMCF